MIKACAQLARAQIGNRIPSSRGLKWSGIRAVAKVTAPHLHSHGCQRLKGLEPLKHLLASSSILHVVKVLKAKETEKERERAVGRMWEGQGQLEGSLHFTDTKPYHTVTLGIIVRDRLWAPLSQNAGQNNTPPEGLFWQPSVEALTAAPCKAT